MRYALSGVGPDWACPFFQSDLDVTKRSAKCPLADDAIETREIDRVVMLGQTQPQAIFEIMGRKGELTHAQVELRTRYSEGLTAYRARHWDEARRAFAAALESVPNDGPSSTFIKRVDGLMANPPGEDWDGSWHLEQK